MKTILFYDTETTGLPEWSKPSEDPCQPRITQIAAELCEEETGKVIAAMNFIIRPDGWVIPEELQQLTGITMQRAEKFGVPMNGTLQIFIDMWEHCTERVAHNESFDMRMIRIDNILHATMIPMPATLHMKALMECFVSLKDDIDDARAAQEKQNG